MPIRFSTTPLRRAAVDGESDRIGGVFFIRPESKKKLTSNEDFTALHLAAAGGRFDVFKAMEDETKIHIKDYKSAFNLYSMEDETKIHIREYLSNWENEDDTALHRALLDCRLDVLKALVGEMVNETKIHGKECLSNRKNEDGNTAMHLISASCSSDPSLEIQTLKELLLVQRSNPTVMRVNSIWGQSDLSNGLNDRKVNPEWYNKDSRFKNKSYYDSFKNNNVGFLKDEVAFNFKECLTNHWENLVAEAERTPWKEVASFRTRWLYAGANYRRMVEPIAVAEYYKHYKNNGRSQCYKNLKHSLGEAGKPLSSRVGMKKQNVSASLMEDSCFWAHVEEYLMDAECPETKIHNKEYLSNKKNEDSNTQMHLTTLNKSFELTSTMAQDIEVKKLTNNLQAFPVVLVDTEHRQVKTVNSFLAETRESSEAMVNAMEAGEFTAVNVPSDVLQSQSSFLANSHPKNNRPMKIKVKSGTNARHLLLLIAALVSTITYHTALKIQACKSEQGCNYNSFLISSLISSCQIVVQHPLFIQLVMTFNSIAFFLSVALLLILFNELPLRPLLLVSAFSMLGAYICAISDLTKPASALWCEG